ncbi:hypothetical protein GLYMA_01G216100v4 [Glycine max]|uniref:Aconitase/3-isopropylmalate dehydratase large subunit alpha/beta/alpha domain-containing protein n=1 Tax=Glycine max TaxID=3847 RepID=A0A0R0LDY8_SOYBN|nr:hypothetical protein JHK85_002561 [Glycine max]KAH1164246.1 hypothetical protein GYH30_002334 [Glycine max]KRH77482.1 hypothetical protein GLYMA_01G216100v4 [Glycine max]
MAGTDLDTTIIDGLGVARWRVGGIEAEAAMLGQNTLVELCSTQMVGTDSDTSIIDGLGVGGWGVAGIEAKVTMLGQILSDSQKRTHYDMYLLYRKKLLMQMHSGQGSKLQIYKSQAIVFKEMEVVEWLKWCRLTINNILAENKMVVGTGYFDVFERDFYSAIHATYYGPKIQSMELLPDVV